MKKYDLIIACGGTGGHIYPALAIAEAMKSYHRDVRILFVVRDGAMEQKVFPESGFDFITIKSAGFSRVSLKANIKLLWVLPSSFVKAISVLITAKPSAVLSTGGYSGLPVLAAARILRKKIFLQEQNTYPGVTVRLFAGSADCVYLGYREAAKYLPVQTRYMETGNPIRLATGKAERNIKGELSIEGKKLIFVSGGSQGAQAVNKLIASMLPEFIADESLAVVWQCGRANEDFARKAADGMKNVHVMPFIDNIYDYYKAADLAICRSGAMTLSELAKFGLPAILIPLPNSAGDHQKKNAIDVEARGGAVCFNQNESSVQFKRIVQNLLADTEALGIMRKKMGQLFRSDSPKIIADDIRKEIKK